MDACEMAWNRFATDHGLSARSARSPGLPLRPLYRWCLLYGLRSKAYSCPEISGDPYKTAWARAQRACADVGIAPGSAPFDQCVVDLFYSVWDEEYETER